MKILAVTRKNLIEWLREPQLMLLVFVAPLLFTLATIVSYPNPSLVTHTLLVVDAATNSAPLLAEIAALRYPDGRAAFTIREIPSPAEGEAALLDQSAAALLILSPAEPLVPGAPAFSITFRGDALYNRYYEAGALLNSVIQWYADPVGAGLIIQEMASAMDADPSLRAGPQNEYDLYVPGMIVFAILLLVPQTAMLLGREVRAGTLRRLRLAPLSAFHLLGGVTLAQMLVAALQVAVVLGGSVALGFHSQGSFWLALLIGLAISFAAIGQGLIVACFVANDSQAVNYGSIVTMLQVFISGAFFPMPAPVLVTFAGHELTLFDLIPASHGMLTLQQVLVFGAGLQTVGFRLALMLALSAIYVAAGVFVFGKLQLRKR